MPKQKRATQPPEPRAIDSNAIYTYRQVADVLNVSERSVKNAIYGGRMGHIELNRTTWRVLGRQVLDYVARSERGPIR